MKLKKWLFITSVIVYTAMPFERMCAQSVIPADAKLETLKTGFLQPEGPVWIDSLGILFSDIKANKIYRWSPVDSSLSVYLSPSDSSNGLTVDLQGRLILTQMEKRRVARQDSDGTITPLVSLYNGKKFNSPNDIVVKSDGSIFFTDPDFNIPLGQSMELSIRGIYRISPAGVLRLLDSSMNKPNGICFSPDEKKLYVNESAMDTIYVWDVVHDSTIANKRTFYVIPGARPNIDYVDGMKIDSMGNVYCTGMGGVWIISPEGVKLDKISMPVTPSNCNWGDSDRKTLFITGGKSLYRIRLAPKTTASVHQSVTRTQSFELYPNYPNPFNPSTNIRYTLSQAGYVSVEIFDDLGRRIALLTNEFQTSGLHEIVWDGDQYTAGVYFLYVRSGNSMKTQKMILLK
jgi:gluconolactonase